MLFNSNEFIFVFLPLMLTGFYLLGSVSRNMAVVWLIACSVLFYALWRPINVLLIAPSILINYGLARLLQRFGEQPQYSRWSRPILVLGILFNVSFLGYFKYRGFFLSAVEDMFGGSYVPIHLMLPLGISFITFQKIAFLVDVHGKRVESFSFRDYCLFVFFFPQLIAGPIVHYREVMPQFRSMSCRWNASEGAIALTLFAFGLFKKVVLADGVAPQVSLIYQQAAAGEALSLIPAWMGAIGFTLQIYFDFSGYSDMALGLARFFGVRLPANFDSPLRRSSIVEYWLHWHMTLTRFLTAYIYNPLVLALTRRRLARGQAVFGGLRSTLGSFLVLLVFPTVVTMLVSGLWHGAGYTFIIWGMLHGIYLSINHVWRWLVPKDRRNTQNYQRLMMPVGVVLTFLAAAFAMVFFRSPSVSVAIGIAQGMFGFNGVNLPPALYDHLGPLAVWLRGSGMSVDSWWNLRDFILAITWTATLLLVTLAVPNTLEVLSRYEPALTANPRTDAKVARLASIEWRASIAWAIATAAVAAIAISQLSDQSEFLYWQF